MAKGLNKVQIIGNLGSNPDMKISASGSPKGSCVYVEGRLQIRKYIANGGVERTAVEIVAIELIMLSAREEKVEPDGAAAKKAKAKPGPAPFGEIDELAEIDDVPF